MTVCDLIGGFFIVVVAAAVLVISNLSGSLVGVQGRLNERTREVLDSASAAGMRGGSRGSRGSSREGSSGNVIAFFVVDDDDDDVVVVVVGEGRGQFERWSLGAVATRFRGEKHGNGSAGGEDGVVGVEEEEGAWVAVTIVVVVVETASSSYCRCWNPPSVGNFSNAGDGIEVEGAKFGKRKFRIRSSGSSSPSPSMSLPMSFSGSVLRRAGVMRVAVVVESEPAPAVIEIGEPI